MTTLTILSVKQGNEFYEESRKHNGGGYDQPTVIFEIEGKQGVFKDTSCGEFGSRYFLEFDGKAASWGTMLNEEYSDFSGKESYFESLSKEFGLFAEEIDTIEMVKNFAEIENRIEQSELVFSDYKAVLYAVIGGSYEVFDALYDGELGLAVARMEHYGIDYDALKDTENRLYEALEL